MCSRVATFTVTPLPWLPSSGLTTTGRPISFAATQASYGLLTGRPWGTGTPAASSRRLLRSLSWAISSDTALVASTSAAQMRRCLEPQPNCTRLPWVRRRNGMPRAMAASTMEPVLGPRRTSSSVSRSLASVASASNSPSSSAARTSWQAASKAMRPTSSSLYSTTTS